VRPHAAVATIREAGEDRIDAEYCRRLARERQPDMTAAPGTSRRTGGLCLVLAHPDDESFFAAGVVAHAVRDGRRVELVVASRGEAGSPAPGESRDPAALAVRREAEMHAVAALLGIARVHWLGLPDRGVAGFGPEHVEATATALRAQRPDVVFTFAPDGHNGHPDHVAIHRLAMAALDRVAGAGPAARVVWTGGRAPWLRHDPGDPAVDYLVDVRDVATLKRDALLLHRSQHHVIVDRFLGAGRGLESCEAEAFRHGAGPAPEGPRPAPSLFAGLPAA
jgi:LmbE family N-acetylglucosaminyl deacetylase